MLLDKLGKTRKAAYLTPDYTYGHTVFDSMTKFTEAGGWTTVTNQLFPLGATDYSAYALNIANSGADTLVVIGFGNDAVNSIKQAKQFGLLDKMTLVVPYMSPYLVQQVGQDLMAGVYAGLDFYWDIGDKFPLAKQFVDKFEAKYGYKPEWGAHAGYLQIALWADAVETAGTFYPPEGHQGLRGRQEIRRLDGRADLLARRRPPAHPPGDRRAGQEDRRHEEQGRLLRGGRDRARRQASCRTRRAFGCKLGDPT